MEHVSSSQTRFNLNQSQRLNWRCRFAAFLPDFRFARQNTSRPIPARGSTRLKDVALILDHAMGFVTSNIGAVAADKRAHDGIDLARRRTLVKISRRRECGSAGHGAGLR